MNTKLYGTLGMYKALIYNRNVATSITAMGRTYISTAGLFFEQFLADNVKFSSLDEVVMFIRNTKSRSLIENIKIVTYYLDLYLKKNCLLS